MIITTITKPNIEKKKTASQKIKTNVVSNINIIKNKFIKIRDIGRK